MGHPILTDVSGQAILGADMRYRFLLRPGWIAAITALLLLTAAFVGLGLWQFGRAHRTHKLNASDLAQRADPVPIGQLLQNGDLADAKSVGHAVVISGTFDGQNQLLVPDREVGSTKGYLVIAPLKLADGTAVVVNRGWTAQPTAPVAPSGPVTVTGWLAAPGSTDDATPAALSSVAADPGHRIAAVDIASLVNRWPYQLDQAYVSALSQAPADAAGDPASALTPVPAPAPPSGKTSWNILNLGYTLQWWVFGIVALWWFVSYVRRLANPAEPEAGDSDDEDDEDVENENEGDENEDAGPEVTPRSPAPEPRPAG
jgi:cytochrome oxidase assembly protein ShyY1